MEGNSFFLFCKVQGDLQVNDLFNLESLICLEILSSFLFENQFFQFISTDFLSTLGYLCFKDAKWSCLYSLFISLFWFYILCAVWKMIHGEYWCGLWLTAMDLGSVICLLKWDWTFCDLTVIQQIYILWFDSNSTNIRWLEF